MKKTAYWHVYLTENDSTWAAIVMEQLGVMERSGLLTSLNEFKITAIYRPKLGYMFETLIKEAVPRATIDWVTNPYSTDHDMLSDFNQLKVTENITFRKIYKDCLDIEQNVLYFHTKGITADLRYLSKMDLVQYQKYYYWRQFLNWGVLDKWRCCLSALKDHDAVGPNYRLNPRPHFSGSFWWSKSDHIRNLPDPANDDWWQQMQAESDDNWFRHAPLRHKDEFWITSNNPMVIDLVEGLHNPAESFLSPKEYWSK